MIFLATIVVFYLLSDKSEVEKVRGERGAIDYYIPDIEEELVIENDIVIKPVRSIDESDYVAGNINAPVQMIIYSDFDCPFSAEFYSTTKEIVDEFGDDVVLTFRHFPMGSHAQAMPAAIASECAAKQGKFWQMYDELFKAKLINQLSINTYLDSAEKIGLDMSAYNQCLQNENTKIRVKAQMIEAKSFGVIGTPTIFVNGDRYPGAYPMDDFINDQGEEEAGMRSILKEAIGSM